MMESATVWHGKQHLKDFAWEKSTLDDIVAAVAQFAGLRSPLLVFSRDRSQHTSCARQITMYLVRQLMGLSYPKMGRIFERNHATILHDVRIISGRCEMEPIFGKRVEQLRHSLEHR